MVARVVRRWRRAVLRGSRCKHRGCWGGRVRSGCVCGATFGLYILASALPTTHCTVSNQEMVAVAPGKDIHRRMGSRHDVT